MAKTKTAKKKKPAQIALPKTIFVNRCLEKGDDDYLLAHYTKERAAEEANNPPAERDGIVGEYRLVRRTRMRIERRVVEKRV